MEQELGVKNGLVWWFERKHIYPRLYWMAIADGLFVDIW